MDKGLYKLMTLLINFLLILINKYEEGVIDYETFNKLAKAKIILLKDNVIPSDSSEVHILGNDIIERCYQINQHRRVERNIYK